MVIPPEQMRQSRIRAQRRYPLTAGMANPKRCYNPLNFHAVAACFALDASPPNRYLIDFKSDRGLFLARPTKDRQP